MSSRQVYRRRITTGRYPFEIFLLILCMVSGVPLLAGAQPASVEALLPHAAVYAWGVCLTFGPAFALFGIAWADRITGLSIERVALTVTGSAALFYAVCLAVVVRVDASVVIGLLAGFGGACFWQARLNRQLLARIRQLLEEPGALADYDGDVEVGGDGDGR